MKQVFQNPKSGKTLVHEITAPVLKSGGILVKNHFSVISAGTERGIIELSKKSIFEKAKERPDYIQKFFGMIKSQGLAAAWRMAQSKLATDIALGYSSAGSVRAVGASVGGFAVGDRVACAGQDYASHAEYIFVPKNLAVKIPDGVSERDAAFVTLGSIAMQGIRRAELTPGECVGVVGLGLLGQLAVRMLKAYGHPVMGFDVNPAQVEFALKNGLDCGHVIGSGDAEQAVSAFTNGRGMDAVLIYASAKTDDPLTLAVSISRDRGRVVQIGNIKTDIPWRDFYAKELTYLSSRSYGPGRYDRNYEEGGVDYPISHVRWTERRNMEEFLRLLADKEISVENLVTRTFDIADAESAYALVQQPEGLLHGLVLAYPDNTEQTSRIDLSGAPGATQKPQNEIVIGLIGMGSFMQSTILPHLKEVGGVRVKAIAHTKGLPAKKLAESIGASMVTSDYHDLIRDPEINLIICATRHSTHASIAIEVLKANKNLYMEKPLALNGDDLREVLQAARQSTGRLLVGFNRRFSKHSIVARQTFASSSTPLQIMYRVNAGPLEPSHWSYDPREGGRILGEACHFTHLLNYFTGSVPRRISLAAIPAGRAIAHEEDFSLTIEYANGSLGTVVYSALGNFKLPKEYIEIYGSGNIMTIDNFKSGHITGSVRTEKINLWRQDKGYTREMAELIAAMRDGKPSPMSLEEIDLAHRTIFAAMESLKTGAPVDFS